MLLILKLFLTFLLINFAQVLSAKVVYISWMEQLGFYPIANQLVSIDLENGSILTQKTFTGSFFSSLAINNQGNNLYVADTNLNRIILVNTENFTIKKEWGSLPQMPEKIIYNEANNHLYFANTRSAGTGQDLVYQIDLDTNIISSTNLPVNGLDVQGIFWSTKKKHLIFKVYNINNTQYEYFSFRPSDMQLVAFDSSTNLYKAIFDDDGIHYYGYNSSVGSLEGYQLTDGAQVWSSSISFNLPISFIVDFDVNSLVVIDAQSIFQISKNDGSLVTIPISLPIQQTDLIDISYPFQWCITGTCSLANPLEIKQFSQVQHTFDTIFESPVAGAQDFVFGNLNIQTIPVMNLMWTILLIFLFLTLYYFIWDRHKQDNTLKLKEINFNIL